MKKLLVWLFGVLLTAALLVGATVAWFYYETDNGEMPAPLPTAADVSLEVTRYDWRQPVLFGVVYKPFSYGGLAVKHIAVAGSELPLSVQQPEGLTAWVTVQQGEKSLFAGDLTAFSSFRFPAAGSYDCALQLTAEKKPGKAYGTLTYSFIADVAEAPKLTLSAEKAPQGSLLALEVSGLLGETAPTGTCELGPVRFYEKSGAYIAYIPVSYNREVGEYTIEVTGEGFQKTASVQVVSGDFARVSAPASAPTQQESAQFRNSIWPLYDTADTALYAAGKFLQPVVGETLTPYGARLYVGTSYAGRHSGVDIAASAGTPVACPAAGRVVFSGFLGLTGNTVVVEHGLGLKSYYFYLNDLYVSQGETVEAGKQLGTVGTTGRWSEDAAVPHLHYEVKIGNQSIDPDQLENGEGGFFTF